jgi:hypothetical protein
MPKSRAGNPDNLKPKSAATISASGVEWLTQPCLLLCPAMESKFWNPRMHKCKPEVDRWVVAAEIRIGKK